MMRMMPQNTNIDEYSTNVILYVINKRKSNDDATSPNTINGGATDTGLKASTVPKLNISVL